MQDAILWQDILAAPTALATPERGLEWAITESMRKVFGLGKADCAIALLEYRRFRYLVDIADEPILASPLIAFIQARDTPNSAAFGEAKRWSGRVSTSFAAGSLSFVNDPAYRRALVLYQQEFNAIPMWKIWPTRLQAGRRNKAFAAFGLGMVMAMAGNWAQSDVLVRLGFALSFLALFYVIFVGRHWGEPQGDA